MKHLCLPGCCNVPSFSWITTKYRPDQIGLICIPLLLCSIISRMVIFDTFYEWRTFFKSCNICQIWLWSAHHLLLGGDYRCTCTSVHQIKSKTKSQTWNENSHVISIIHLNSLENNTFFCEIQDCQKSLGRLQYQIELLKQSLICQ